MDEITAIPVAVIGAIAGIISGVVSTYLSRWLARQDKESDDQSIAQRELQDAIEQLFNGVMDVGAHTSAIAQMPAGRARPPYDPGIYRAWVVAHARVLSLNQRVKDSETRMLVTRFAVAATTMAKMNLSADEVRNAQADLLATHIAANNQLGQLMRSEKQGQTRRKRMLRQLK